MKRPITLLLFTLCAVSLFGQTYTGKVVDDQNCPLSTVSVILKDAQGKTIAFGKTANDGRFSVQAKQGAQIQSLTFSLLGFGKKDVAEKDFTNGSTITLEEQPYVLQEVKVKPVRIRQSGDTLSYSVASFREKQDRSIADVIARMPGLEVKGDGTIQYQGKNINKFYIEGMDLLGSKYSQASENLSVEKVKSVELMENHQPVKMLNGVRFSEQAALNIVLKENAKNVWSGLADIATGMTVQEKEEWLRSCRLMEMLFSRRMQSISMFKCDNTGKDIMHEVTGDHSQAVSCESHIISDIHLTAPALEERRSLFNDTYVGATNWLFKSKSDNDFRIQLNFLYDKCRQQQTRETRFEDMSDTIIIAEDRNVKSIRSEYSGELMYKINKDKTYLTNTLSGYMDFNRSNGRSLLNGNEIAERVMPRKRYLSNKFAFMRNIGGDRSVSLNSTFQYNHLPARLLIRDNMEEQVTLNTLSWNTNTSFRHKVFGFHVTWTAGFNVKKQSLGVDFLGIEENEKYAEQRFFLTPVLNYQYKGFKVHAQIPFSWISHSLNETKKSYLAIEPNVLVNYEFNPNISASAVYFLNNQSADVRTISNLSFFTSYNRMQKGYGMLDSTMLNTVILSLKYKNVLTGLFANMNFTYNSLRHTRLYESSFINNVYVRTATDRQTTSDMYSIRGNISQSFGMKGFSVSVRGGYLWNNYYLLVNYRTAPFHMHRFDIELNASFRPLSILSIEGSSAFERNKQYSPQGMMQEATTLKAFHHDLKAFIQPGKWQITWKNELYHSNDKTVSFNFFSDFSVSYRKKTFEVGLYMNNILGNRTYERRYITDTQRVYTTNRLRPREILARVIFNM